MTTSKTACAVVMTFALVAAFGMSSTQASIMNMGVDIATDGTQTVVPFFDESAFGAEAKGAQLFFNFVPGETLTITFDAASVFGPGPVVAAELFIDAFDVDWWNSTRVWIQGEYVGQLANTPSPSEIPVEFGPVGTHVINDNFDVDNTFFDLTPFLDDLATDSTFTIEIQNTTIGIFGPGEEIRVDGLNIQAFLQGAVPEPGSLLVWSVLAGIGCMAGSRRRMCRSA